jgi:hypothetical protein
MEHQSNTLVIANMFLSETKSIIFHCLYEKNAHNIAVLLNEYTAMSAKFGSRAYWHRQDAGAIGRKRIPR